MLLMFVVCRMTLDRNIPEFMSGLCVGAAYFTVTLSTNRLVGSAVNPALTLPIAIVNSDYENLAIFLTAPFIGSLLGVFLSTILSSDIAAKRNAKLAANQAKKDQLGYQPNQTLLDKDGEVSEIENNNVPDRFIEDDEGEEMIREE